MAKGKGSSRFRKKRREVFVLLFIFLPFRYRLALDNWLRGRKEFREIRKADIVFISPPKCGRTWLRALLSRFFQKKHGLPEDRLLGFDNYHRLCSAIPKIRFSHDKYVSVYTRDRRTKRIYYDKKAIILVREPRDVVVSNYFQWTATINPFKKQARRVPDDPKDVRLFDFAMDLDLGLPRTIRCLNECAPELPKMQAYLLVRYEELRAHPTDTFKRILSFMELSFTDEDVEDAVGYASFENMRKLETSRSFDSDSRRRAVKDPNDPNTFKVRQGKVGGFRDHFFGEQLAKIKALLEADLAPVYGYCAPYRNQEEAAGEPKRLFG
jgi:hypothetical protein